MITGKNQKEILNYVNVVYGGYIKLKEIHFNTTNQAEHLLTDNSSSDFLSYADQIMENVLGMFDTRFGLNILEMKKCNCASPKEVYAYIREEGLKLKSKLDQPIFAGMNKILDDFIADLNKWIYLSKNK